MTQQIFEKLWNDFTLRMGSIGNRPPVRERIEEELARNFAKHKTTNEQTLSLFVYYCAGWKAGLKQNESQKTAGGN